jgi:hypothetical protein
LSTKAAANKATNTLIPMTEQGLTEVLEQ